MAYTTRNEFATTLRHCFFISSKTASTRSLVETFELIGNATRSEVMPHSHTSIVKVQVFKLAERLNGCSGETFLAPCARKKRQEKGD